MSPTPELSVRARSVWSAASASRLKIFAWARGLAVPSDVLGHQAGLGSRMNTMAGPAAAPPATQKREFWVLMGYTVALGVFGAFVGLVFLWVIKFGGSWYSDSRPGWFGGHWWWVAVTAAAGVVVGLLRRLTRLPREVPGMFDDLSRMRRQ